MTKQSTTTLQSLADIRNQINALHLQIEEQISYQVDRANEQANVDASTFRQYVNEAVEGGMDGDIDQFVTNCINYVNAFAARQTERGCILIDCQSELVDMYAMGYFVTPRMDRLVKFVSTGEMMTEEELLEM